MGKGNKVVWVQLHLIVDAEVELPIGYEVGKASESDTARLLPMMEKLKGRHPELVEGTCYLVGDKGYDAAENNRVLWEGYRIKPVIDTRAMWKGGKERKEALP